MKRHIVETLCDVCDGEGVKRPAKAESVTINGVGPAQLDLCEEHESQMLLPLLTLMVSRGVTEDGKSLKVKSPRVLELGVKDNRQHCEFCGKRLSAISMPGHVRTQHPDEVDEYMKKRGLEPQKCPTCGGTFYGSQALTMHQRRAH